jgi:Protein of unknown function (DUF3631)
MSDDDDTLPAIERTRQRWAAYQLDLKPTEADGMWVGQCPTHRSEAMVRVEEGVSLDDPVTIDPCRAGCPPEWIIRTLGLTGYAEAPPRWQRIRKDINVRRFGSPEGADQYTRVVAALFAQGLDGRRSDVDGVRGEGRYQCPVCGAKGDGHGLKVRQGDSQPVVLHCFECDRAGRSDPEEILKALGLKWADISRPLEEVTVLEEPGSAGSPGSVGLLESPLEAVRDWFARFICAVDDADLDLLTLWAAHTHLCLETHTTPRLVLDSPVPGSGKTTVLEHLERLCLRPIQMASLSSPALLTRMLDADTRTVLIDEADRNLNPDRDGVGELLAVLNSGYKRGSTRPVLVPVKGGGWEAKEMPTFAPVAMAGNNPNLPDDTRSRSIRVLLMPDVDGLIEDSDWEEYEEDARRIGGKLEAWADMVRDEVRTTRAVLPDGIRGRTRERWAPLKRVADAAGGRWPALVDELAVRDMERIEAEREEGIVQQRPAIVLLSHLHEAWDETEKFVRTETLIDRIVAVHPEMWGDASPFGKRLTPQRFGRMLSTSYNIHSNRAEHLPERPRGYLRTSIEPAFRRFGLSGKPTRPAERAEPAAEGKCTVCDYRLDKWLITQGETMHPGCSDLQRPTRTPIRSTSRAASASAPPTTDTRSELRLRMAHRPANA